MFTVFGQNYENDVKNKKSAWIGFLVLNVPYFVPSFGKIVGAHSSERVLPPTLEPNLYPPHFKIPKNPQIWGGGEDTMKSYQVTRKLLKV